MPATVDQPKARASDRMSGDVLDVSLSGVWRITDARPSWSELLAGRNPATVRVDSRDVVRWDSSLLLFVFEVEQWCRARGARADLNALPEKVRSLLAQLSDSH